MVGLGKAAYLLLSCNRCGKVIQYAWVFERPGPTINQPNTVYTIGAQKDLSEIVYMQMVN